MAGPGDGTPSGVAATKAEARAVPVKRCRAPLQMPAVFRVFLKCEFRSRLGIAFKVFYDSSERVSAGWRCANNAYITHMFYDQVRPAFSKS